MQLWSVIFVFFTSLVVVTAYSRGPPTSVCGSMKPQHGVEPQTGPPQFKLAIVSPSSGYYTSGQRIEVKVSSINNATFFEGILVQARLRSSLQQNNEPLTDDGAVVKGTFNTENDPNLQTLACFNTNKTAIGHNAAKHYYEKTFSWTPANDFKESIQFVATVVREKEEIWLRVTSPPICYNQVCPTLISTSTRQPMTTTTTRSEATPRTVRPSSVAFVVFLVAGRLMTV